MIMNKDKYQSLGDAGPLFCLAISKQLAIHTQIYSLFCDYFKIIKLIQGMGRKCQMLQFGSIVC